MSSLFVKWGRAKTETEILAKQDLARDEEKHRLRQLREEAKRRAGVIDLSFQWREPTYEEVKARSRLEIEATATLGGVPFYPEKRR